MGSLGKRIDDPLTHIKDTARWVENPPIGDAPLVSYRNGAPYALNS
jgi:hypothetical protein